MAFLPWKSLLSESERLQRRRLMYSDAIALSTLLLITVLLAVVTTSLYRSYATHQAEMARRWQSRGEAALKQNRPQSAVDALRSALALTPEQRNTKIELAEALASAGQTQQAISYFNTLLEEEPGNGMIHLQLARLAAQQGNVSQATEDYHRAIYGTWNGNGYIKRREVRLEMVRFFIAHAMDHQAQSELLITAGNAPEGDSETLLKIANLMEQANDPASAYNVYKAVLKRRPSSLASMEGAGRAAFAMGRYVQAKQYLTRAQNASQDRQFEPKLEEILKESNRLIALDPSTASSPREKSQRILNNRKTAHARLNTCLAQIAAKPGTSGAQASNAAQPDSTPPSYSLRGSLENLASRLNLAPSGTEAENLSQKPAGTASNALASVEARWKQQPQTLTISQLDSQPGLAQTQIQLIFDIEEVTQTVCGPPTGDDALLLKLAQSSSRSEQE